jgi:hypothetical protein
MAVIVWLLDLQLPMQSVHITTDAVGSTPAQGVEFVVCFFALILFSNVLFVLSR